MARIAKKASISMSQFVKAWSGLSKARINSVEAARAFTRLCKLKQKR